MGSSGIKEHEPYTPNQELYHKRMPDLRPGAVNWVDIGSFVDQQRMFTDMQPPIDRIATALGKLTYGQMIALAEELWEAGLQGGPHGGGINGLTLPSVLHKWSLTYGTPRSTRGMEP